MNEDDEIDCQTVSRLISEGQDRTLEPPERARLHQHFALCQTCRDVDEQLRFLSRAMKRLRPEEPPAD